MDHLTTIRLYGFLRKKFGPEFRLAVRTPAEACHALCQMVPGFKEALRDADGYRFRVRRGSEDVPVEHLKLPHGRRVISITPMTEGAVSIKGIITAVVGIVLIIVGAVGEIFSAGTSTALVMAGISLTLSGLAALLSPSPKANANSDKKDNQPSYQFSGPINTQTQGGPVPVLYGELIIGSAVVSASIEAKDITPTGTTSGNNSSNQGGGHTGPGLPIHIN